MTWLIDASLRISMILAAGLLARAVVRRHSPTLRHLVLATAIVAAPAVVPLGSLLPAVTIALPHAPQASVAADPAGQPARDAGHPGMMPSGTTLGSDERSVPANVDATRLVLGVWIAGAVAGLLMLAGGLWRLARLTSRARAAGGTWADALDALRAVGLAPSAVTVRVVDEPTLLATWGWRRPVVLIPRAAVIWPADRARLVLRHELAHVTRADWLVQLYAEALRALLWWNPLIWIACRRLRHDAELACDDAVLASGVAPHAYADHLVAIVRDCGTARQAAATPMAHPSTLHRRIAAMLNPRLDRTRPTRRAASLTIAALVVAAVLPAAVLRGAQGPQPLEGVIYDPTGAVMPGVAVALTAGADTQTVSTDAAGHFRFDPVAPGRYVLDASLAGFKRLQEPVTLQADADWSRVVTLQIGDVQESITIRQRRIAPQQPAGTAGPTPVRVGGNIRVPVKLQDVRPVYPPSMLEAGREGNVTLEASIDVDGSVSMARVISTQVHPDFAAAAIEAVRKWRYRPTLLNGKPVAVVMSVKVSFALE